MDTVIHQLDRVNSTITWCEERLDTFDPNKLTIVSANELTAGIGRLPGRRWISPRGKNVAITAFFFPEELRPDVGNLSQLMALCTCDTLETLGLKPCLRWPNDLFIGDKKVGGIITRIKSHKGRTAIGLCLGLNVNTTADQLAAVDQPATSMMIETEREHDRDLILTTLIDVLVPALTLFLKDGFAPFLPRLSELLQLKKGMKLRVCESDREYTGKVHKLNDDGSLSLQLPLDEIRTLLSGEVLGIGEGK